MLSIIYVSSATWLIKAADLADLLQLWRPNNARIEVTGMLLYKDGNFMQVIEGEESNVRGLYEKLKVDPRHTGILTLLEETIATRQFDDWSMGFKNLDEQDLSDLPGYIDYENISFLNEEFAAHPSRAKKLLEMFRQKM